MSPQEFARNEKAIMQQLKNGQIKPSSAPNVDFESFKNLKTFSQLARLTELGKKWYNSLLISLDTCPSYKK